MHLFTLTRVQGVLPGTDAETTRPRVPEGIEWGQATDTLIGPERSQVVVLHCDDEKADEIAAKLLPGEGHHGRILGDSDRSRIKVAFATPSPDFAAQKQAAEDAFAAKRRGDTPKQIETILKDYDALAKKARDWHAGPLGEWHASYRSAAKAVEDAEKARKTAEAAKAIVRAVLLLGINAGLAWACGHYGVALAMAVVTSDYFTGGDDADITGRTSDASGGGTGYTWAAGAGGAGIVSGEVSLSAGANTEFYLSDMPNMADGDVRVKYVSGNFGTLIRESASGTGYMAWRAYSLYRNDGFGAFNEIASGASPVSGGNPLAARCSGTTISRLNNGSVDGTTTSSSYTTGKAGIASYGSGVADEFVADESAAAGGHPTMRRWGGVAHMAGQPGGHGRGW